MNKKVFILLNLFVLTILANEFSLKIEIVPKKTILGTPIYLEWVMKNESKAEIKTGIIPKYDFLIVITDENGKELKRVGTGEILYREGRDIKVIKRGEEIRGSYNLSENYRLVAGVYKVYLRWRSNGIVLNAKTKQYETVWAGDIKSNEEEFIIEEPNGIDKEVYNKYHYEPEGKIMCCNKPNEVLEKYPTSTYAGWVLFSPGTDLEWASGKDLIDDMLKPVSERKRWGTFVDEDKGKGYKKSKDYYIKPADEEAREYLEFSEKFLSANPNHINAGIIYARQSLAYMVLGKWEDAYKSGKLSLEKEWPLWVYSHYPPELEKQRKILKEALDEMVKRGFVKDKK